MVTPPPTSKRRRLSRPSGYSVGFTHPSSPTQTTTTAATADTTPDETDLPTSALPSSWRHVSSCNRCRLRKGRCDQRLPRCQPCEKAGVRCVGYDPITKREIPRSYVFFLEARGSYFKRVLQENGIQVKPDSAFYDGGEMPSMSPEDASGAPGEAERSERHRTEESSSAVAVEDSEVRHLPMSSLSRFADLFSGGPAKCARMRSRESLLHTLIDAGEKRTSDGAVGLKSVHPYTGANPVMPVRDLGLKLVNHYFEHANPQMPALHRGDFMGLFDRTYTADAGKRSHHDLFLLHIVFAIGAGIIDDRCPTGHTHAHVDAGEKRELASLQLPPAEYYASAAKYLESAIKDSDEGFGKLEGLQAVILLAHFALLQPVAPGPVHLTGVAMRTAADLRLYTEDDTDDAKTDADPATLAQENRTWDYRRRLWWCVYSLDRVITPHTGQPFSIPDHVVTTEFPARIDDRPPRAFLTSATADKELSSKYISHQYFKLRMLQSEIHAVLRYRQAQLARRRSNRGSTAPSPASGLSPPFLHNFDSFTSWRTDMNRRLDEWKSAVPAQHASGTWFPVVLLELDYWQTVNVLYRQSIRVPRELKGDLCGVNETARSGVLEDGEDEANTCAMVVESSQKVLQIYRLMHHVRLVNYTYLATNNIFLAGLSLLS